MLVFIKQWKRQLMFLFFGCCTTMINIITYFVCYDILICPNLASTIIAWVVSVAFAFGTNRGFVYESTSNQIRVIFRELILFFASRAATGILDLAIMYYAVDIMQFNSMVCKVLSNIIVVILNYFWGIITFSVKS